MPELDDGEGTGERRTTGDSDNPEVKEEVDEEALGAEELPVTLHGP